jgi:hypothetical protein
VAAVCNRHALPILGGSKDLRPGALSPSSARLR